MALYPVGLAGESFANADGSSRQAEIARCIVGERVSLVREPDNPYDPNAILACSARGIGLGYVSRDKAMWMAEILDRDAHLQAVIFRAGHDDRGNWGVVLSVSTSKEEDPRNLQDEMP